MTLSPLKNLQCCVKCQLCARQRKNEEKGIKNAQLADETILVDRLALLAVGEFGSLGPHLLDVLENHVHVSIEGLDAGKHLATAAERDENLRVRAHSGLEDGEGTGGELVLLERGDFILTIFGGVRYLLLR